MELETLKDLYIHELKDLYSAENQLLKALPKMAKAASNRRACRRVLPITFPKPRSTRPGWKPFLRTTMRVRAVRSAKEWKD